MGDTFASTAMSGPLVLAILAAALAGLASFLSPCVLPLVPGYLSYITGLTGADLETPGAEGAIKTENRTRVRGRVLAGTLLFIGGFTAVFTLTAVLLANVGTVLREQQRLLEIGAGLLIIVLGLGFMGVVPGMQREFRLRTLPDAGLLGAPLFGAVFALSWTPCIGPTLASVMTLATVSGQADRAAVLAVAYGLGLGVPFLIFGLGFKRLLGLFKAIRRNSRWVTRIGGGLLVAVGLALVTGGWNAFLIWMLTNVGVGSTPL